MDFLSRLGHITEGLFRFKIKQIKAIRSNQQNMWYHACIVPAFKEAMLEQGENWTDEAAHEQFRQMFLLVDTRIVNTETGEIKRMKRTKSTTELNTTEFADYCEQCRQFLAEWFNVVVPDPDPAWRTKKNESKK